MAHIPTNKVFFSFAMSLLELCCPKSCVLKSSYDPKGSLMYVRFDKVLKLLFFNLILFFETFFYVKLFQID